MAFIDYRLPEDVERGARGGPKFNTTVAPIYSGYEKRNINWAQSRGEWDISYGIQELIDLNNPSAVDSLIAVQNLFYAARGRAHSFRFKDWSDFQVGQPTLLQQIGVGDSSLTQFQIYKQYDVGGLFVHRRTITKPRTGTVIVHVDNSVVSPSNINYLTGVITLGSAPTTGHTVKVYCEYDVPVRFDSDEFIIDMRVFNAGSIPSIRLVEVRGE